MSTVTFHNLTPLGGALAFYRNPASGDSKAYYATPLLAGTQARFGPVWGGQRYYLADPSQCSKSGSGTCPPLQFPGDVNGFTMPTPPPSDVYFYPDGTSGTTPTPPIPIGVADPSKALTRITYHNLLKRVGLVTFVNPPPDDPDPWGDTMIWPGRAKVEHNIGNPLVYLADPANGQPISDKYLIPTPPPTDVYFYPDGSVHTEPLVKPGTTTPALQKHQRTWEIIVLALIAAVALAAAMMM